MLRKWMIGFWCVVVSLNASCAVDDLPAQTAENGQDILAGEFAKAVASYVPKAAQFEFRAKEKRFGHLNRPWATNERLYTGSFLITPKSMILQDTAVRGSSSTDRTLVYSPKTVFQGNQEDRPIQLSLADHQAFLRTSCRYTPAVLFLHVLRQINQQEDGSAGEAVSFSRDNDELVATGTHGEEEFEIRFSKRFALKRIRWMLSHELWGDQSYDYEYSQEKTNGRLTYPQSIKETTYDVITFQSNIIGLNVDPESELIAVDVPKDYQLLREEPPTGGSKVEVEKYSDHVTFLLLPHCESRSVLVEFRNYLMVIDAPKNSVNGQLILDKIDELQLDKPIKYFAFGHHHPHYLGGVRPFVARGATILTTETVAEYVKQVAEFPHSRTPDELQKRPRQPALRTFKKSIEIGDNDYKVSIHDIGEKSKHTDDYLLFYFPTEKLLFQDDGIWLRDQAPVNARTLATYNAIEELGLEPIDCIQGWPTKNFGVKTKIKFEELKQSVEMDDQSKAKKRPE